MSAGLLVLHKLNFIHRDLKPQNILLSENSENATIKIADFGFARALNPTDMAATVCGSPLYMAPEILRHERYDAKADLWSIGSILYELIFGRPPFSGPNPMQLLATIENSPKRIVLPKDPHISKSCESLLSSVLIRDPAERMNPDQFFCHEFNLGLDYNSSADKVVSEIEQAEEEDIMLIEESSPLRENPVVVPFHSEVEPVMLLSAGPRLIADALAVLQTGPLADSYSGTQCALGMLLRHIALEVLGEENVSEDSETRTVDSLGIIARSCQFLDNAIDEVFDKASQSVLTLELKTSLEVAQSIQSKLSYRGHTCSAKPLRWVYAYVLDLVSTVDQSRKQDSLQAGILLIDFLISEFELLNDHHLPQELDGVKEKQENVLNELRDRIRILLD